MRNSARLFLFLVPVLAFADNNVTPNWLAPTSAENPYNNPNNTLGQPKPKADPRQEGDDYGGGVTSVGTGTPIVSRGTTEEQDRAAAQLAASDQKAIDKKVENDKQAAGAQSGGTSTNTVTDGAKYYVSDKYNNALYKTEIDNAEINQGAIATQMKVLSKCVTTSIDGRTDDLCKAAPDAPECVGSAKALINATNCLSTDPVTKKCVEYGSGGYTTQDWLAFAGQYSEAMVRCFKPTEKNSQLEDFKKQAEVEELQRRNLPTDILPTSMMASANEKVEQSYAAGSGTTPADKVSGVSEARPVNALQSTAAALDTMISRYSDGSVFLGFDNGEVLRRTVTGEPFAEVIGDSPFVKGLDLTSRQSIAAALEDKDATIAKAMEKKVSPGTLSATDKSDATQMAAAPTRHDTAKPATNIAESSASAAYTNPSVPLPPTPAEEAALVIAREKARFAGPSAATLKRRELASIEKISGSALHPLNEFTDHSAVKDSTTEADETSLFTRVHSSYRKRAKAFVDLARR